MDLFGPLAPVDQMDPFDQMGPIDHLNPFDPLEVDPFYSLGDLDYFLMTMVNTTADLK